MHIIQQILYKQNYSNLNFTISKIELEVPWVKFLVYLSITGIMHNENNTGGSSYGESTVFEGISLKYCQQNFNSLCFKDLEQARFQTTIASANVRQCCNMLHVMGYVCID